MKKIDHKEIKKEVRRLIKTERYYRDINMTRDQIAQELGVSISFLSAIMEEQFKMPFPDLINKYRASYAKRLLRSKSHRSDPLDDIAILSGFSCRMSLHRAFLQFYGITPGAFRRQCNSSRQDKSN